MNPTKSCNGRIAQAIRRKQIDCIHRIFDLLPMTDEDGDALARCLATLMRGQDLTPSQEATYQWWIDWLKVIDTATFAKKVEAALDRFHLPALVRAELCDARSRLWSGKNMTPRQAGLWGAYVVSRR